MSQTPTGERRTSGHRRLWRRGETEYGRLLADNRVEVVRERLRVGGRTSTEYHEYVNESDIAIQNEDEAGSTPGAVVQSAVIRAR